MAAFVFQRTLLALNLIVTVFLVVILQRESSIILYGIGKTERIEMRLQGRAVNYELAPPDRLSAFKLVDFTVAAGTFHFVQVPTFTSGASTNDVCVRIKSINTTVLPTPRTFWTNTMRPRAFVHHSISTPNCDVVNLRSEWLQQCITDNGDAQQCYKFISTNFASLASDPHVQVGVSSLAGEAGEPFLKCRGRGEGSFRFIADLVIHQPHWMAETYQFELHSSLCEAESLLRDADWEFGLFRVKPTNTPTEIVLAMERSEWFGVLSAYCMGIVTLVIFVRGIIGFLCPSRQVHYVPKRYRFRDNWKYCQRFFPSMPLAVFAATDPMHIQTFRGSRHLGAGIWMNHWLFIGVCTLDAFINIRLTCLILDKATALIIDQVTFDNFCFLSLAAVRLAWLMCLLMSCVCICIRVITTGLTRLSAPKARVRSALLARMDAHVLFHSWKQYFVFLMILMLAITRGRQGDPVNVCGSLPCNHDAYGTPTAAASTYLYGDVSFLLSTLAAASLLWSTLMLATPLKRVARNHLVQTLQQRRLLVGWDAHVAITALRLHPTTPSNVADGVALARCSLGVVLQQLYLSGPSGLVEFAGDMVFESVDSSNNDSSLLHVYSLAKAAAMGLHYESKNSKGRVVDPSTAIDLTSTAASSKTDSRRVHQGFVSEADRRLKLTRSGAPTKKPIKEIKLRLHSESIWGSILFVDVRDPGGIISRDGTSDAKDFVVEDAMGAIAGEGIAHLLSATSVLWIV